jgi:glycerol kinase
MRGKHVLSIDQGTTGTSVLIFDSEGEVRSRAYSEFTQYYPRPGWVEHDASEIWQVSIGVIAEALKAGDIPASDVGQCKRAAKACGKGGDRIWND